MGKATERFWITKYAIAEGILERECTISDGGYAYPAGSYNGYRIDRDAFRDLASAKADAEKRRKAKIASLKRQLTRLEAMKF